MPRIARSADRLATLVALIFVLLAPSALAAWPMDGGDARRSTMTTVGLPTRDVAEAWNGSGQYTGVVVAPDGSVIATGENITVWESDGRLRWTTRTISANGGQEVFRGRGIPGILSDGTIVVPGARPLGNAAIVGFDPATGLQRFANLDIRGRCDSPSDGSVAVAADDSFYIAQCGPGVVGFYPNGTIKWTHSVNAERLALHGTSLYLVADHYTPPGGGDTDDLVLALSTEDGRFLWAKLLSTVRTDVVVDADGRIFVADGQGVLALDPINGTQIWSRVVPLPQALAITPNGSIAAGSSLLITYLSPETGDVFAQTSTRDGSQLVLATGMHLRSRDTTLAAIDSSGNTLWEVQGTSPFQSNIAIGNAGEIYVAEGSRLVAYAGAGRVDTPATPGATPTSGSSGSTPTSAATPSVDVQTPPRGTTPTPAATPAGSDTDDAGGNGAPAPGVVALLLAAGAAALVLRRR